MRATTELQRQKAAALKAMRTAIRLKYSLLADDEIARVIPELEDRIDAALAAGEAIAIDPGSVFAEVDG